MKRHFLVLFAIAVFVVSLTTTAQGQTSKTLRANVKFDFQIGDRVYPAGEYRIESLSTENVLQIRSVRDVNRAQFIFANHSSTSDGQTPKLVFQKYGERYFLTQIFLNSSWGYSITPSNHQPESEKNLASRLPERN